VKLPPIAATALKALLVLLIIPAFVGIYWLWLIWRYDRPYHRIVVDDTEARVVALLGRPYEIQRSVFSPSLIRHSVSRRNPRGFGLQLGI